MARIFCMLFLVLGFIPALHADLNFTQWNQKVNLTSQGKEVLIQANLKAVLKPNYFYTSWSYIFDSSQKIEITGIKFNGESTAYDFQNNQLKIKFKELYNGDQAQLEIAYTDFDQPDPYLRQEWIQVPSWLAGVPARVEVTLPSDLRQCSLNPEFQNTAGVLVWNGNVPKGGFKSLFKLSPMSGNFAVQIDNDLNGTRNFKKLTLWYPQYFQFPGQTVMDYQVLPTVEAADQTLDGAYHEIKFENTGVSQIKTRIRAQIQTGPTGALTFNPQEYLSYAKNEKSALESALKRVRHQPNPYKLPEYVRIGQWVYGYLKYDISLTGKKLSNFDLLRNPRGVCEHYSQLYQALLRYAGIPAFTVSGYAYNSERGWDAHAWVLLYIEEKWVAADPTWGLFSGNLPVSHIYFYADGINQSRYQTTGYDGQVQMKTKVSIQNL